MKNGLLILLLTAVAVHADPVTPASKTDSLPPLGASLDSAKSTRRISIRGKFDADRIIIQNGSLWIEHISFENPTDISINGVHWKPQWNGKISDRFTFKPALESFDAAKVQVKKIQGRSELDTVQPPTPQNKQMLSFKVIDQPVGIDTYEVRVRW